MSETEGGELTQDTVFEILSNSRRRFMLSYLNEHDGPVDLMELANEIAAWENETTVDELTDKQSKRVYVSVYQTHVPKLEATGLIDYDSDSGLIELSERASEIDRYMPDEESERPWHRYYVGLAIASAVFYGAVALGVPVLEQLTTAGAGVVVVVAVRGPFGVSLLQAGQKGQHRRGDASGGQIMTAFDSSNQENHRFVRYRDRFRSHPSRRSPSRTSSIDVASRCCRRRRARNSRRRDAHSSHTHSAGSFRWTEVRPWYVMTDSATGLCYSSATGWER